MDQDEQDVVEKVQKFGWTVFQISPSVGSDDPDEWFAYTVGLRKTYGWPELICFGLAQDVMHSMLNCAVEECQEQSATPFAGMLLKDVLNNAVAKLAIIAPLDWIPRVAWARWLSDHYELPRGEFDCLQLLWPDKAGRFPDEPDCDDAIKKLQTPTPDEILKVAKADD